MSDLPPGFIRRDDTATDPQRLELGSWEIHKAALRRMIQLTALALGVVLALWVLIEAEWMWDRAKDRPVKVTAEKALQSAEAFVRSHHVRVEVMETNPPPKVEQLVPSQWEVRLTARGRNQFGGPVRDGYVVRMASDIRGAFHLHGIQITAPDRLYSQP